MRIYMLSLCCKLVRLVSRVEVLNDTEVGAVYNSFRTRYKEYRQYKKLHVTFYYYEVLVARKIFCF